MRLTTAVVACSASFLLSAQGKESTEITDSGMVVLHWFTSGDLSTKAWMDANNSWGHSWAYNKLGDVIFDRQTRRVGGHASVDYRYHPNGAVSRADYSTMPDGGIQWYKSTTTFDTAGVQTGFSEQGWDNKGPMRPQVSPNLLPAPPAPKPKVVHEQRLFVNEYFVVARKNCRVQLRPKHPGPGAKNMDATLLKGDTLRGGMYSLGERFDPPLGQVAITASNRRGKPKFKVVRTDSVQVSAEHRRWYLIVGR